MCRTLFYILWAFLIVALSSAETSKPVDDPGYKNSRINPPDMNFLQGLVRLQAKSIFQSIPSTARTTYNILIWGEDREQLNYQIMRRLYKRKFHCIYDGMKHLKDYDESLKEMIRFSNREQNGRENLDSMATLANLVSNQQAAGLFRLFALSSYFENEQNLNAIEDLLNGKLSKWGVDAAFKDSILKEEAHRFLEAKEMIQGKVPEVIETIPLLSELNNTQEWYQLKRAINDWNRYHTNPSEISRIRAKSLVDEMQDLELTPKAASWFHRQGHRVRFIFYEVQRENSSNDFKDLSPAQYSKNLGFPKSSKSKLSRARYLVQVWYENWE